jgi:hypothetical protein
LKKLELEPEGAGARIGAVWYNSFSLEELEPESEPFGTTETAVKPCQTPP